MQISSPATWYAATSTMALLPLVTTTWLMSLWRVSTDPNHSAAIADAVTKLSGGHLPWLMPNCQPDLNINEIAEHLSILRDTVRRRQRGIEAYPTFRTLAATDNLILRDLEHT